MQYYRTSVRVDGVGTFTYYSSLLVELNDRVVVETRSGCLIGLIESVEPIDCNPFDPNNKRSYHARRHLLENATKKLYDKENKIMFGSKTVEVKHVSSNRVGIYYTDLILRQGDLVVYETTDDKKGSDQYHQSVVTNADPDVLTAQNYIVDIVNMQDYYARAARIKQANKLKQRLDAKKKQYQDIELLRLIAASDPETKDMLDEYTALISGQANEPK